MTAASRLFERLSTRRTVLQGGALAAALATTATGGFARSAVAQGDATAEAVATGTPNEQMAEVLAAFTSFGAPPLPEVEPRVARELPSFADALAAVAADQGVPAKEDVGAITTILIPGPGGDLPAWVSTPDGDGPFPVVVYFHGGGWVIANIATYQASARALANAAGCVVVSVGYRQAPEFPFPAAADDAYAALQWVIANADQVGGDPARVAVGGESAGGNLATVACLLTRDQGGTPPVHQLLVYPVTTFAPEADPTAASTLGIGSALLDAAALQWFGSYYQPDPTNPYASPLTADVSGLPPATVVLAEIDPLRGQGEAYAMALEDAGVDVSTQTYEGVTHEFFGMGAVVDEGTEAVAFAAERLTAAFEGGGATPTA